MPVVSDRGCDDAVSVRRHERKPRNAYDQVSNVMELSRLNSDNRTSHKLATATDLIVYGLILSFGALQFGLAQRAPDFFRGDTIYIELAQSIMSEGFYGFNSKPETRRGHPLGLLRRVPVDYLSSVQGTGVLSMR